jgi:hypothetical protein
MLKSWIGISAMYISFIIMTDDRCVSWTLFSETSKKAVLRIIGQQDAQEEVEAEEDGFRMLLG